MTVSPSHAKATGSGADELALPVLIRNAEFAQRKSVLVDEITDDLIAEAAEEATERDDTDDDDSEGLGSVEEDSEDDDDLSLSGQSYIRSGEMSGDGLDLGDLLDQLEDKDGDDEKAQNPQAKKRRVHFALNEATGKILCHEHEASHTCIRSKDKELCWYRRRDFKEFKGSVQREMAEIRRSDYYKHYLRIFHACSSSEQMRTLTQNHMAQLADTPFRGYELQIFGPTLISHRTLILMRIRETQMQHYNLSQIMTDSERWEALGARCRVLTKQNRRLAHLLGSGDAAVAGTDSPDLSHWLRRATSGLSVISSISENLSQCSIRNILPPGTTTGIKSPFKVNPKRTKSSEGSKKSPIKATRSILAASRAALSISPLKTSKNVLRKTPTKTNSSTKILTKTTPSPKKSICTKSRNVLSETPDTAMPPLNTASPTKSSSPKRIFRTTSLYTPPTNASSAIDVRSLPSSPDLIAKQQNQQNQALHSPKQSSCKTSPVPQRSKSNHIALSSPSKSPRRAIVATPSFKPQEMVEL